jgi:threonine dehydrogenase-like Zn-dependent dehydrogenase
MGDGGMAEYAVVPERNLVPLPTGLDISAGSLVEPLAVAVHGLDRVRVRESDRVLVIGAGPIGLASAAALQARGIPYAISARHEHQRQVAEQLGAGFDTDGSFDVVIDAVGTSHSLDESVHKLKPMGRIGMVGSFWDPTTLNPAFCMKEIELIASATYVCKAPDRNFEEAGRMLAERPELPELLVTHRFPLDAVDEAFAAAADRAAGAIKVVFDV